MRSCPQSPAGGDRARVAQTDPLQVEGHDESRDRRAGSADGKESVRPPTVAVSNTPHRRNSDERSSDAAQSRRLGSLVEESSAEREQPRHSTRVSEHVACVRGQFSASAAEVRRCRSEFNGKNKTRAEASVGTTGRTIGQPGFAARGKPLPHGPSSGEQDRRERTTQTFTLLGTNKSWQSLQVPVEPSRNEVVDLLAFRQEYLEAGGRGAAARETALPRLLETILVEYVGRFQLLPNDVPLLTRPLLYPAPPESQEKHSQTPSDGRDLCSEGRRHQRLPPDPNSQRSEHCHAWWPAKPPRPAELGKEWQGRPVPTGVRSSPNNHHHGSALLSSPLREPASSHLARTPQAPLRVSGLPWAVSNSPHGTARTGGSDSPAMEASDVEQVARRFETEMPRIGWHRAVRFPRILAVDSTIANTLSQLRLSGAVQLPKNQRTQTLTTTGCLLCWSCGARSKVSSCRVDFSIAEATAVKAECVDCPCCGGLPTFLYVSAFLACRLAEKAVCQAHARACQEDPSFTDKVPATSSIGVERPAARHAPTQATVARQVNMPHNSTVGTGWERTPCSYDGHRARPCQLELSEGSRLPQQQLSQERTSPLPSTPSSNEAEALSTTTSCDSGEHGSPLPCNIGQLDLALQGRQPPSHPPTHQKVVCEPLLCADTAILHDYHALCTTGPARAEVYDLLPFPVDHHLMDAGAITAPAAPAAAELTWMPAFCSADGLVRCGLEPPEHLQRHHVNPVCHRITTVS